MKRKIFASAVITAVLLIITAVSASACRQLPYYAEDAVNSGEISLGKTEITTDAVECRSYSFTPDKDGFYSVSYYDHDCSFLYDTEEDGEKCFSFYYYISTEKETGGKYVTTEFVKMEKGNTYHFYAVNPDSYDYYGDEAAAEMTSTVEIKYEGTLTDFNIYDKELTFFENTVYDEDSDSFGKEIAVEDIEKDDNGASYIYTWFDVSFSEGGNYSECCLNENSCGIMPLEIVSGADIKEGTNTVGIELLGLQKNFEIICSYDAEEFVEYSEYGALSAWASRTDTLIANLKTGIRVMLGLEGIGSPRPSLGMEIIRLSVIRFFNSFSDTVTY